MFRQILVMWLMLLVVGMIGCTAVPAPVAESEAEHEHEHGIQTQASEGVEPAFDLILADVQREGDVLVFRQQAVGEAGSVIPEEVGQLGGAEVASYVWPTSLDSATVGFEPEQGILSLAVTSHPDFDDTPLVDENGDGDPANDGREWHSHWVVLVNDDECGEGALKVKDIPEGETPAVPETWPELPILIDSPNYDLALSSQEVTVSVPQNVVGEATFNFDGVTAGLRVNVDVHSPLLCVSAIHDIASGDLSLPGQVE